MPERGPVQLLLHFLARAQRPVGRLDWLSPWSPRSASCLERRACTKRRRQALPSRCVKRPGRTPLPASLEPKPWPWDQATPAVNSVVPRLGLSAAIHCDDAKAPGQMSEPSRKPVGIDARDPHLASDDAGIAEDTDAVRVTGDEVFAEQGDDDRLWEPGAPPPAITPSPNCSPLDPSIPGAIHLMIEAIQGNRASSTEIEQKL